MKKYLSIVAAFVLLTGCTTTDPVTGEKVFDPVKTDLLVSSIEDGLTEVVYWTAKADDNTASAYRIAHSVLNTLVVEGETVNRELIKARLATVAISGMTPEDSKVLITRITDIVLGKWDIIANSYIRIGIGESQAASIALNTCRNAIFRGLLMLN
jgi:hypothetical protein